MPVTCTYKNLPNPGAHPELESSSTTVYTCTLTHALSSCFMELLNVRPVPKSKLLVTVAAVVLPAGCPSCHPTSSIRALTTVIDERPIKQVRKVLLDPEGTAWLLTLLCHYGHLCINIHHYAPPTGCSITHRAATSLAAAGLSVSVKFQCQVVNW